MKRCIISSLNI